MKIVRENVYFTTFTLLRLGVSQFVYQIVRAQFLALKIRGVVEYIRSFYRHIDCVHAHYYSLHTLYTL